MEPLTKALMIRPRDSGVAGIDVLYYAGSPLEEVCSLTIPSNRQGLISPDGVFMLIAYLKRIVEPYADRER